MLEGSDATHRNLGTPKICLASRADPATADRASAPPTPPSSTRVVVRAHARRERFFLVVPLAAARARCRR